MPKVIDPSTGEIYELRGGEWQSTNRRELAGKMAAEGMGPGESFLVGAGRELSSMGAGIRNIYAQATGDQDLERRIAGDESEAEAHLSGTAEALPSGSRLALEGGRVAPYLATLPLGVTATGARGLLGSMAVGSALGGAKYSGDQGLDAITSGLLSGAGYGLGALAGRTVSAIRASGTSARAAMIDAANAGIAGKALRAAQEVEAPTGAELGHAIAHSWHAPLEGAKTGAKWAALKALQNQSVANALLTFAGASGGRGGILGGAVGRLAPSGL